MTDRQIKRAKSDINNHHNDSQSTSRGHTAVVEGGKLLYRKLSAAISLCPSKCLKTNESDPPPPPRAQKNAAIFLIVRLMKKDTRPDAATDDG